MTKFENEDFEDFQEDSDFFDKQNEDDANGSDSEGEWEEEENESEGLEQNEQEENKQSKDPKEAREKREKQKEEKLARKAQKPNFDLIEKLKKIWEGLRRKDQKDRKELMAEMMELTRGKCLDIIFKHDASRIIQAILKYGNKEQREQVALELKGKYAVLSQSKYGKFIVSKILQYCSPKARAEVIKDFNGKVCKLVKHKEASVVLDEAYSQFANAAQRTALMEEFYGPEYAVFKTSSSASLQSLLEQEPLKKPSILRHMKKTIHQVLEKASFNLGQTPILHRAILDYLNVCPEDQTKDTVELLKDHLVHMLHTREGALITRYCLLHATPKDRKVIIKSFKGFVPMIAREQYGHVVLITCFECIDDTVLVGKAIIQELFANEKVNEFLRDLYGSRVVLYLLSGRSKRYQPAYVLEELKATDEIRALTTKKDHEARHQQNLEIASPLIIDAVAKFANELLRDKIGSTLLIETCNTVVGDINPIISAVLTIIQDAKESPKFLEPINVVKKMKQEKDLSALESQGLDMNESIIMNRWGSLTIKNLIRKPVDKECPRWKIEFITKVWDILKDRFVELINHCAGSSNASGVAFIFVALFEAGNEKVCKEMSAMLNDLEKKTLREKVGETETGKKRKSSEDRKSGLEILLDLL